MEEGQRVKAGEKLISFDREKIKAARHLNCVVVLATDPDDHGELTIQTGPCRVLDKILQV